MAERRTFAQVRDDARAERDIEVAAFLDGHAAMIRAWRSDPCAREIATACEGLASSLRAGLIDDGMPTP